MPETKSLFNRVAEHYDLLNTLFSFGMDKSWRKRLAREVSEATLALDVATGTAGVAVEIVHRSNECSVIGIDPSKEMLELGLSNLKALGVREKIILVQGFAENLPFKEDSFDAATIAFGIRNTVDPLKSLREMKRILKPGSKVGILEFAVPRNKLFSPLYMFYLRNALPFIGSFFGKKNEYKYLARSIPEFPQRDRFIQLMEKAGFRVKKPIELTMGAVVIYIGVKDN
jgi:demethylmenaquinone methyltransferase / 2-methoxy-6-polyprenyl-1,4-benzoquinol methylase